jgi:hypothetical protein
MALERDPGQNYHERRSAPAVARWVASAWVLEVDAEGGAYEHRTAPDGSVEISYTLRSDRSSPAGRNEARSSTGSTVVGIRFRPGVAPSILGPPASELVDLRVNLDRLWGSDATKLAERLGETGAPGNAVQLLEGELVRRLADATAPDSLVTAAIGRLQPWRTCGLDVLASDLYICIEARLLRIGVPAGESRVTHGHDRVRVADLDVARPGWRDADDAAAGDDHSSREAPAPASHHAPCVPFHVRVFCGPLRTHRPLHSVDHAHVRGRRKPPECMHARKW